MNSTTGENFKTSAGGIGENSNSGTPDHDSRKNLFIWLPMSAAALIFIVIICVCIIVCRRRGRRVVRETYNHYSHVDQTEFVDFVHSPERVSNGDIGYEDVTIAVFETDNSRSKDDSELNQMGFGDKNSNILENEKFMISNIIMSGPRFSKPKDTFSPERDQNLPFSPSDVKITTLDVIQAEKTESENFQIEKRNECHNTLGGGPQFSGPGTSTLLDTSTIPGSLQSSRSESEKSNFFPEGESDNYYILKPAASFTEDKNEEGSKSYFTLELELSPK